MKTASALVVLALACCGHAARVKVVQTTSASPVGKVVQLLGALAAKITRDGEAETKAHEENVAFCKDGKKDLGFEIKTGTSKVADYTATILKATDDVSAESSTIEDLAAAISQNEADLNAATGIRNKENAEFKKAEAELADVIDTLDRAINVLQRELRGSSLAQTTVNTKSLPDLVKALGAVVDAASLSAGDKQKLVALAQSNSEDSTDADDAALGAPTGAAYTSKSEGIIEVLEDLREKAEHQLSELRKQELNSKHAYDILKLSLKDQLDADNKDLGQSKAAKASAAETQATSEGNLKSQQKSLADTEAALKAMTSSCETSASDYAAAAKSRSEELKALADAQKIISEQVGGAALVAYSSTSLLQLTLARRLSGGSRIATRADLKNFEVVTLLRSLAQKEGSAALAQLADRVADAVHYGHKAGEDPFGKVKSLIKDMVAKLEKEAGEEANHKEWCDEQMGDTKAKKEELTQEVEKLSTKIDKAKAEGMQLKEEVKSTQAALAELSKLQSEMDTTRAEESKAFQKTKTDLTDGLKGVRQAVAILRDYYENADASHEKSQGSGNGIIAMLEVVESDLSKSLTEAEMDEDSSAREHEKVSMSNSFTKQTYEADVKYKSKSAAQLEKTVASLSTDLDGEQSELDAVFEYEKTIKVSCVEKPESYEGRKGRREAEVAGLKEALEILQG